MTVYPLQNIKQSIVQINYNGEYGTGFFVSESLLVTAYHVLEDFKISKNNKINLQFFNKPKCTTNFTFDFIIKNESYDLAIIEIKNLLPYKIKPITIMAKTNFIKKKKYDVLGYPLTENEMRPFSLEFNDKNPSPVDDTKIAPILQFNADQIINTYKGLSGAPIILNNCAIGWIIQDFDEDTSNLVDARSFADELLIEELNKKKKTKDLLSIKNSYVHEWIIPKFSKEYFSTYMIQPFIDYEKPKDAEKLFLETIKYFTQPDSFSTFNILTFPELFLTVSNFFSILKTLNKTLKNNTISMGTIHLGLKNDNLSDFNRKDLYKLFKRIKENKDGLKISKLDLFVFKTSINKIEKTKNNDTYRVNIFFYFDQNSIFRFCLQVSSSASISNSIFVQSIQLCDYTSVVNILPISSNEILNSKNQKIFDQEINKRIKNEEQKIDIISSLTNTLSKVDIEKWYAYKNKFYSLSNGKIFYNFDGFFLLSANSKPNVLGNIDEYKNLFPNISGCLTINEIDEPIIEYENRFDYFKDIEFYNKNSSSWESNQKTKGRVSVKCVYHSGSKPFRETIMISVDIDMVSKTNIGKIKETGTYKLKNYNSWEKSYD